MPHCRTDGQGLTCGRGLLPPAGRRVGLTPRHRAAGRPTAPPPGGGCLPGGSLPPGAKMRLKINFIYIKVSAARQEGGSGAGYKSVNYETENIFLF